MSIEAQFLTITPEAAGTRLDAFLASQLNEVSRTRVQKAIEGGDVLVNDRTAKPSYRLKVGDRIEIDLSSPPPLDLLPEALPLKILYEDRDLIVVNKPAGMVVHPGAGIESGTLANALLYHFNQLSETAGRTRPGIVHRIDKETSGLLVVAKNEMAHENLSDQFRDRRVFKMYLALVYGHPSEARGEIEVPISRNPRNRTRMAVASRGAGRAAYTDYEVARRFREFSLLTVRIKTGRTHQIRVHLAHIGHPVVADFIYGRGRENSVRDSVSRQKIQSLGRHFLHAAQLAFNHPRTGERMEFASDLPPELSDFLAGIE